MKLIVGIGNPGSKYINTRHNVGFQVLDFYCQNQNLIFQPTKSNFWLVESKLNTFHFFLMKPTTYVNNSGIVVKEIVEKHDLSFSDLLVIYDDINLSTGSFRIRKSGSDGGHNGIKSIIYHLESDQFARLRIGVGEPEQTADLADHVLSNFSEQERKKVIHNFPFYIDLIQHFITDGISGMLNFYSKESNVNSSNIS